MADKQQEVEFLRFIVEHLVNHPDEIEISRTVDELGVLLELEVHPDDMGIVIGRNGSTAKALRTLLRIIGARNDARVNLKLIEPEGSEKSSSGSSSKEESSSDSDEEEEASAEEAEEAVEDLEI